MRIQLSVPRMIKLSGQASVLALLAGLGGCSSMFGFDEPLFTGSTANQREIVSGAASPAAPSAPVQQADLAPPAGAPTPTYAQPAAAPVPKPYVPPKPYAASGMPTPLGEVARIPTHPPAAQPTPTLQGMGTPPTTLNAQAGIAPAPSASGGTHVVQAGDTAYNISRRYGVPVNAFIAANGGTATIKLGQTVVIPGGGSGQPAVQLANVDPRSVPQVTPAVIAPAPAPAPLAAAVPAAPVAPPAAAPAPQGQQVALAPQTGAAGAAAAAAPQASAEGGGFRWPVRGRVISGFGKKPNGERNDGINLAVPEGSAVKAAEDGTVIYAGNELKSYGNLVLIRHPGGWVSAYAHNSELKVKRGEEVRRGQIVALSGMSGGVTTPQVHFELRKDATPVDPLQHLTDG
jgi:murein DD-endopeptidase MepM/ murein hydrolase activator NlpD